MRAGRAISKASEGQGDQYAAARKLSNAHVAELQLLRVPRSEWYGALRFAIGSRIFLARQMCMAA